MHVGLRGIIYLQPIAVACAWPGFVLRFCEALDVCLRAGRLKDWRLSYTEANVVSEKLTRGYTYYLLYNAN